ncbi:MAG: hypothetical protein PUC88_00805 [Clostridia bacterium]|nr:hypothetical protein [Clostridia bacterium]
MKKERSIIFLIACLILCICILLFGCSHDKEDNMKFEFEAINDLHAVYSSYIMDFGTQESQEDAAITEGKLLTAFGKPIHTSENYENSFEYVIKATSSDGQTVLLSVYGMGVVHIGAKGEDDFTKKAANALVDYVEEFPPADYEHTLYYLDFDLKMDIQVKDGKVSIEESQIPADKSMELFNEWY